MSEKVALRVGRGYFWYIEDSNTHEFGYQNRSRRWTARRLVLVLAVAIVALVLLPWDEAFVGTRQSAAAASGLDIVQQCCEYAPNPLGLGTLRPRFTWVLSS